MMTPEQAAEALQVAHMHAKDNGFFFVSHILGADWGGSYDFKGDRIRYMKAIIEVANAKFGTLPYNPFAWTPEGDF